VRKVIRPGKALGGETVPKDGYLVPVSVRELYNDGFMRSLTNWIRGRVLCKFPQGVPADVVIHIKGDSK
jgi:hypothetical protein